MNLRKSILSTCAFCLLAVSALAGPWSGSGTYYVGTSSGPQPAADYATLYDFAYAMTGIGMGLGTVTFTAASTAVVGVGTQFTTQLAVGDQIGRLGTFATVASITDDTNLVLTAGWGGTTAAATTYSRINQTAPAAVSGNVTIEILSNITEPQSVGFTTAANGFDITLKPNADIAASPVVLTFPNSTGGAEWGGSLVIGGANATNQHANMTGFTIDGSKDGSDSRDLRITQGGTGAGNGIVIVGNQDDFVLKNIEFLGTSTSGAARYSVRTVAVTTSGPTLQVPENGLIENCVFTNLAAGGGAGIAMEQSNLTGGTAPASGTLPTNGWTIRDNEFNIRIRGVFMNSVAGITIEDNVFNMSLGNGFDTYGIWHNGGNTYTSAYTQNIRNNTLNCTTANTFTGAFGITAMNFAGAAAAGVGIVYNINNNVVVLAKSGATVNDINLRGIRIANNSPTYNVYNNSVYLPAQANVTGALATKVFGIGTAASPSLLNLKNNIIVVGESGAPCLQRSSVTGTYVSNTNSLLATGGAFFGNQVATTYATLALWQGLGHDAGSFELDPTSNWTSDLHFRVDPGAAYKFGETGAGFPTEDIDGESRTNTTVGADIHVTSLWVVSANSDSNSPNPPVGINPITSGTTVLASAPDITSGNTRYVATSYAGQGAVGSGAGNSVTYVHDEDSTITWTWKTQYSLTTAASPVAGGTVTPVSGNFYDSAPATVVPVQATANSGWFFLGWSGDLTGTTNPDNVTIDAAKSVTALFTDRDISTTTTCGYMDWGIVANSTTSTLCITLNNAGTEPLTVTGAAISGANAANFSVHPSTSFPIVIPGGGSNSTLCVVFAPNAVLSYVASLDITSNDPDEALTQVCLTGDGVGAPLTVPDWVQHK